MLRIIARNKILFAGYLLMFIASSLLLLSLGKKDAHILLTGFHSNFLDSLMKTITWFGDGFFMILVGVVFLFSRVRYGLVLLSSFIASSLLIQILKRFVFPGSKRPVAWFHDFGMDIYRIGGVEYHSAFSFPSGHTTTAFALFFGLAFWVKNTWLKILFLLFAIITGFSRVYLSQHFLGDAIAGSLLGIGTAVIVQSFFENRHSEWLDKNIVALIGKKNA
jgi:membrane-associated phospholipid phosphatase